MTKKSLSKKEIIDQLILSFYNSFSKTIIEELNENNYWRSGTSLSFFKGSDSSWGNLKPMPTQLKMELEKFKSLITKDQLTYFVQDKSLNGIGDTNYNSRGSCLKKDDLNVNLISNKIVYKSECDNHVMYAKRSIVNLITYIMKYDRNLLNFVFQNGCDKLVRNVLTCHSHFIDKKTLISKLENVTTDVTRKIILTALYNTNKKSVVSWVNSQPKGFSGLTKGLKEHLRYTLNFTRSDFSFLSGNKDDFSFSEEKTKEFLDMGKSIKKSFIKFSNSYNKSDKKFSDTISELFDTIISFTDDVEEIEKEYSYNKKIIDEAFSIISSEFQNTKSFNVSTISPNSLVEGIAYLPKEKSLFYLGEYKTIAKFFETINRVSRSRGFSSYMRVSENNFGNIILNSSCKLF
jgi:hypothetical protein